MGEGIYEKDSLERWLVRWGGGSSNYSGVKFDTMKYVASHRKSTTDLMFALSGGELSSDKKSCTASLWI